MKINALISFLLVQQIAIAAPWSLTPDAKKSALQLASLDPVQMLQKIRAEKICVKILQSNRTVPASLFHWGKVEKGTGKLEELTKIPGLMGKTLCADEVPLAHKCLTIVLASDAPKTTLVHEYLHAHQIKNDPTWCPISQSAWKTGTMSKENYKGMLDREWEVHTWLWENRDKLHLSAEGKVEVASTLLDQAQKRASFDSTAADYISKQKVPEYLNSAVAEYKKQLGI